MSNVPTNVFLEGAKLAPLIRWFGDPILRTVCVEFLPEELIRAETLDLAQELISVLAQIRQLVGIGRGLAAPQIGVPRRMIVYFYGEQYQVLINPRIVWKSEELGMYTEMCLSGYPIAANVVRPWRVEIEYYDMQGVVQRLSPDPMLSRILQHEIDHLEGILFIDKAEPGTISVVSDLEDFKANGKLTQIRPKEVPNVSSTDCYA